MTVPHGRRWAAIALVGALGVGGCTGGSPATPLPPGAVPTDSSVPGAAPGGGTGTPLPSAVGPLGSKFEWANIGSATSYLRSLGPSPTFYEMSWCETEPSPGTYQWTVLDGVARKARDTGLELMIKIRVGACWVTGDQKATRERGKARKKTESLMPTDLVAYRDFVTTTVRRYSALGVHVYAVENEINSAAFWGASPQDYEKLLGVAVPAIRAADPTAKVADPGISSTAYGAAIAEDLLDAGQDAQAVAAWNTWYARRLTTRGDAVRRVGDAAALRALLTEEQPARNIAYLRLADRLARGPLVDIRQVHFYESDAAAPLLVSYLRSHTPAGKALEGWEVGQFLVDGDPTDAERAQEMTRTVSLLLAGGLRMVIWLPLAVDAQAQGSSGQPRSGLLLTDGTERPGAKAFAAIARAASGAVVTPVRTSTTTGVALTRSGRTTAFLWAVSGSVALPSTAGTTTDPSGEGVTGELTSVPRQLTVTGDAASLLKAL